MLPVRSLPALSLQQARNLQLAAQGLLQPASRKASPLALRRCIARMQLLQIDTIHVVARSPYLVLFSRLGAYPMAWLDAALAGGDVFETWAHEACFVPAAQLALHRSHNRDTRQHWGLNMGRDVDAQTQLHLDRLLAHVRTNGAVRSSDFARTDGRAGGWWGWKDEKIWLEALFARGDLMVARRERFQRVYDLAERVQPGVTLDPLVWDRERVLAFFGFDYRIECYTPEHKRAYGYFVLPLLHWGELIGRLDAKAHREEGVFEVKALFLEPGVEPDDSLVMAVAAALLRCARWHGAARVRLVRSAPSSLAPVLRRALRQCQQEIE